MIDGFAVIAGRLDEVVRSRANAVPEAHRRVRSAARVRGQTLRVKPVLPIDVVGVYVLLPVAR